MSDTPLPASRPKMNSMLRVVVAVCGIVLVVTGIMQMKRGFQSMKGNPEVERLAVESDSAFNHANKLLGEAGRRDKLEESGKAAAARADQLVADSKK